jgi:hypothetical protein
MHAFARPKLNGEQVLSAEVGAVQIVRRGKPV